MAQNLSESLNKVEDTFGAAATASTSALDAAEAEGRARYTAAVGKLREHWAVAKEDIDHFRRKAVDYSQSAAKATSAYAHDHPWRTASAAVGVGALLGWLISRR